MRKPVVERDYSLMDILKVLFVGMGSFFVFLKIMNDALALYIASAYVVIPLALMVALFIAFWFLVLACNLAGTDVEKKI